MSEPTQDHAKQEPETVEDLAPSEDESAELKGGVSGSGGSGAGRQASGWGGGSGAGRQAGE